MPFIDVCCPGCGRQIFKVTDRTVNNLSAKCNICNKLVTYYGASKETKLNRLPGRKSSSGMRFY